MVHAIRGKINENQFEFSRHAVDQTILREISVSEIRQAISTAELIEDYPQDKYGPSCLLFGMTTASRPLHIQVSYPLRPLIKIITAYEPDPEKWTDHKIRKETNEND